MAAVSLRTTKKSPRKPRVRAKGRTVNKEPSFGETARQAARMVKSGAHAGHSAKSYEPNETTAATVREPIDSLTRYRTVDEALGGLKSDAKRRSKSKAKTSFGRVVRRVLKTRKPVVVSTPEGLVQIAPYVLNEEVPPAPPGRLKLTTAEIRLHNTFGETL
ncbi:MAG: hypothetical protein JWQ83_1940 [Lacunisphaera sp.]|nr:hypothetical protein [Lacunisphaera sp.]